MSGFQYSSNKGKQVKFVPHLCSGVPCMLNCAVHYTILIVTCTVVMVFVCQPYL